MGEPSRNLFPGRSGRRGDLDEAVVEGEIVSQGILPSLCVLSIVGKAIHDELIDVTEGEHLFSRTLDRHECQRDIGIGRLFDHRTCCVRGRGIIHDRQMAGSSRGN